MEESIKIFIITIWILLISALFIFLIDYKESKKIIENQKDAEKYEYCSQIDNLYYCYKKVEN